MSIAFALVNDSIYIVYTMDTNGTSVPNHRAIDLLNYTNNASYFNEPLPFIVSGHLGEAYDFNAAANTYIAQITPNISATWLNDLDTHNYALTIWVNATTFNNANILNIETTSDQLYFGRGIGESTIMCGWYDGTVQVSPSYASTPVNQWFMLTCNYFTNGTVEIYINQTLDSMLLAIQHAS
jgi:hypothetical protein